MPESAETTISTCLPRVRQACAIAAILSQRARVDTLVPPNLSTIHDACELADCAAVGIGTTDIRVRLGNANRHCACAAQKNKARRRRIKGRNAISFVLSPS